MQQVMKRPNHSEKLNCHASNVANGACHLMSVICSTFPAPKANEFNQQVTAGSTAVAMRSAFKDPFKLYLLVQDGEDMPAIPDAVRSTNWVRKLCRND